jgi:hypothetical protein
MLKWLAPGNVKVASMKAELLPIKNMEVHVVNSSSLMNTAINLVFPFLNQAIKEQVYFHYHNYASLHDHLGQESLPVAYGGFADDITFDDLSNFLYKHEDILNNSITYGYSKINNNIEGVCSEKKKKQKKHNLIIAESI